jgi:hypothetical protein
MLNKYGKIVFHLNKMDYKNITSSDYIGVTQRNKDFMIDTIEEGALKIVNSE